mgnify:CR=1 FL=1
MKGLAFALDPDGYWVEVVSRGAAAGTIAEEFTLALMIKARMMTLTIFSI